jgi:hypothetical protein
MDFTRGFLDTCVFLARAYGPEMETWSEHCDKLLCAGHPLHTSESVRDELIQVQKRRRRFYLDIIDYVAKGGDVSCFDLTGMSENDADHFIGLIRKLKKSKQADILSETRLFINRVGDSLRDSIGKLQSPIVRRYGDAYMEDLVAARIGSLPDAKVVCDFVGWAVKVKKACFFTLDGGHILGNREVILQFVRDYLYFESPDFDFLHVKDFSAQVV